MLNKIKQYFNSSMEPEPARESEEQATDLGMATRFFYLLGIIVTAAGLVLFPVIGFQLTFILLGILFIGISILLKSQDQILQKLASAEETQEQRKSNNAQREEI